MRDATQKKGEKEVFLKYKKQTSPERLLLAS